jgi:hypothetical protein
LKKKTRTLLGFLFILCFSTNVFAANVYDDVDSSHWAYKAVKQLTEAGIISGVGNNTFAGDKPVSRYEMAQMVFSAMGKYDKADTNQKLLIDALKMEYDDVYKKVLEHDKRIAKLEQEQGKISFSGMFSARYRDVDYLKNGVDSSVTNQYRIRLDGKIQVDADSFAGFRFVTKAPNKNNLFNDSWTNSGGDNQVTANGTNNTYSNLIDRYYYTANLGSNTVLTLGEQELVIDPMNVIVDSTFYSYGGGKVRYKLDGLGKGAAVTAQYGSFYRGVTLKGFTGWGNKTASDFNNVDIASVILNGKVNEVNYQLGYADFKNNKADVDLLKYSFVNVGFLVNPKVGLSFEYANNNADSKGQFGTAKVVYGDQVLKKKGQWNVSYQYLDAQKNAIFNRYAMLEGAAGSNTNHAQKISDARVNYAFSPTATFYIQRMAIDDKEAANAANDNTIWKAELDVKF